MPINVAPPSLDGCRILVVEDEPLVSMMIEDVLTTSGGGVVGPAPTAKEALELLEREAIHCAVLDVKLMDGSSLPVAEALKARAIPFLIVTGVDQKTVPVAYHGAPVLQKVFMPHELIDAVAAIVQRLHAIATAEGEAVHEAWNTT
jgi:DNA-binding response OmpR family regulator